MNKKIIFFDIDGTLVDDETGVIPESTKKAIKMAKENGHYLFINTGRCQAIWPMDILELGFHGVIGGCGTHIIFEEKELLHHILDKNMCDNMVEDLLKYHIDGTLESKHCSYFRHDIFYPVVKRIFEDGIYSDTTLKYWDDKELIFDKCALWHDESSRMDLFKEKYEKDFHFIERDPNFYEVVPRGFSKATGMDWIVEYLGMAKEDTVAVGDSANDIPMFENAAYSIGLKSDKTKVLELVDFVTDTVMNDGVYKGLKHIGVI